jgi:hypothetical protein
VIQVKCTQRIKDKNNKVTGYIIEDINGSTLEVEPNELKRNILTGEIDVINLSLTSDGRLVKRVNHENGLEELKHKTHIQQDIYNIHSDDAMIAFNTNILNSIINFTVTNLRLKADLLLCIDIDADFKIGDITGILSYTNLNNVHHDNYNIRLMHVLTNNTQEKLKESELILSTDIQYIDKNYEIVGSPCNIQVKVSTTNTQVNTDACEKFCKQLKNSMNKFNIK